MMKLSCMATISSTITIAINFKVDLVLALILIDRLKLKVNVNDFYRIIKLNSNKSPLLFIELTQNTLNSKLHLREISRLE